MKILLATGIYPPDIGGPASYVQSLAEGLTRRGEQVTVITYGEEQDSTEAWKIIRVSKRGGMLSRWRRYARALREHGAHTDVILAFSSVSCGLPLLLSCVHGPKKILRLGGDFFWERYTDWGGRRGLRSWYGLESGQISLGFLITRALNALLMPRILRQFDQIVFSTAFEKEIYQHHYRSLPPSTIIENALPSGVPTRHALHHPIRLLFLGRFVAFKNLFSLLEAVSHIPSAMLTLVGDGPLESSLRREIERLRLGDRVHVQPPLFGEAKNRIFAQHDVLILPSLTEISPNVALEARASGLPVLLTAETGLSSALRKGMLLRRLGDSEDIAGAITHVQGHYDAIADDAAGTLENRGWDRVAEEYVMLISTMIS